MNKILFFTIFLFLFNFSISFKTPPPTLKERIYSMKLEDFLLTASKIGTPSFVSNSYQKNGMTYYETFSARAIFKEYKNKKFIFDLQKRLKYIFDITEEQKFIINLWKTEKIEGFEKIINQKTNLITLEKYKKFINALTKKQKIEWEVTMYSVFIWKTNGFPSERMENSSNHNKNIDKKLLNKVERLSSIIRKTKSFIKKKAKIIVEKKLHFNQNEREKIFLEIKNFMYEIAKVGHKPRKDYYHNFKN